MQKNGGKPVLRVRFFDLEPFDPHGEGNHKRECPACDGGLLLMHRDMETGILLAEDVCCKCGQCVVYTDIDRVRRERP